MNILLIIFGGGLFLYALGFIFFRWILQKGWFSLRLIAFSHAMLYLTTGIILWLSFRQNWMIWFSVISPIVAGLSILLMPKMTPLLWESFRLVGATNLENDEKYEDYKKEAKLIRKRVLIRILVIFSPAILSFLIMFFFRTKIGFGLGWFVIGFTGIFLIYDNKNYKSVYSRFDVVLNFICSVLLIVVTWYIALYTFIH